MSQTHKIHCDIHKDIEIRKSYKEYCPVCEGYFSAHGFNNIRQCPFMYWSKKENPERDLGRAYPLYKGENSHYIPEIFNKSLSKINQKKFEKTMNIIFKNFNSFLKYIKLLTTDNIIHSVEREIYSFYLFKKELYESFYSEEIIQNLIPIVIEEWLFIPFDMIQFERIKHNEKDALKKWIKLGIHCISDEIILDKDGKAICLDYKSYPRKSTRDIKQIKTTDKKYQLITGLLAFEYNYKIDVKFIANIDLGTSDFPNISYNKPSGRQVTYYKKALFDAYSKLFNGARMTRFKERFCTNFCDFREICPDEKMKVWRDFRYINIL